MFGFKKSVAGVVKEEFECECCGTLDGQAPSGCGCGSVQADSKAPTGCGCGSMPVTNYGSSVCCEALVENAKSSTTSGCSCSCPEK